MSFEIKNKPLWTSINSIPCTYPWLSEDKETSVCIIGGGISAALCALKFASFGIDTVLLSASPIGFGTTSQSDGIIRTDVSGGLLQLSSKVGTDTAVKIYKRCEKSLDSLENIALSLGNKCRFSRLGNLLYTQNDDLSYDLRKEYLMRKHNGFNVNILCNSTQSSNEKINIKFGIIEKGKSAIMDPFIFTHIIIDAAKNCGAHIYENTSAVKISTDQEKPYVYTTTNKKVTANKIIISTGNDDTHFLKNVGLLKTKFSVVTKKLDNLSSYRDNYIVANKLDYPEITFSITADNRILATGLSMNSINKKINSIIPSSTIKKNKYSYLKKEIITFFSGISSSDIEFEFCYDYFETKDGLPIISEHKLYPNCYFNICAGEDGIIFSEMASNILLGLYCGNKTDLENVFSWQK